MPLSPSKNPYTDRLSPKIKSPNINSPIRNSKIIPKSPMQSPTILASPLHKVQIRKDIPESPFIYLQVENIPADFYQFPLDLSPTNIIGMTSGLQPFLFSLDSKQSLKCFYKIHNCRSLKFNSDGNQLIIGTANGKISIGDIENNKFLYTLNISRCFINAVDECKGLISTANSDGTFSLIDSRDSQKIILKKIDEVSSVRTKFNPSGNQICTTAENPGVKIWDIRNLNTPFCEYNEGKSLVRALDWNYENQNLMAVGGGLNDRKIRIFDINNGKTINSADIGSQVCNIFWNCKYNELLVTHGFSSCAISLWSVSNMKNISSINVFHDRVIYAAISHDKSMVALASPKDPLMVWKLFPKSESKTNISSNYIR